jgi:hypothetical protein
MSDNPISFNDAKKKGKLKQFIKERETAPPGDMALFDKTLASMIATPKGVAKETPKEAPAASPR